VLILNLEHIGTQKKCHTKKSNKIRLFLIIGIQTSNILKLQSMLAEIVIFKSINH